MECKSDYKICWYLCYFRILMKVFELYHREGRFCFPMQLVDLAILHVEAKNIRNEHIFYVQYYNRSVHHGFNKYM
jgi:hypothetical protein